MRFDSAVVGIEELEKVSCEPSTLEFVDMTSLRERGLVMVTVLSYAARRSG